MKLIKIPRNFVTRQKGNDYILVSHEVVYLT